jgi:uncharacterized protein
MRWQGREESTNIEDRRGMRFPGGKGGGFGCIGLLAVMVIALLTGADPRQLLGLLGVVEQLAPQAQEQQVPAGAPPADDPQAKFIGRSSSAPVAATRSPRWCSSTAACPPPAG